MSSEILVNCPVVDKAVGANQAYFDLLKRSLLNLTYAEREIVVKRDSARWRKVLLMLLNFVFDRSQENAVIVSTVPMDLNVRIEGRDWPPFAHTMVGLKRLDNIQFCLDTVLAENIPGDVIEAGVWRGGASILMRAILKLKGGHDRILWVADSFRGLPKPNSEIYPSDKDDKHYKIEFLSVPREQVQANFERYGLMDDRVKFLEGWFSETLPNVHSEKLALIRADGDMYESTMDILINLYPKLSIGGFIIIDDYLNIPACKAAVDDYRSKHEITDEIVQVDWTGVYWMRSA